MAQPLRGLPLRARHVRRPRCLRPARQDGRRARRGPRHRGQPRLLPLDPAGLLRHGVRAARAVRPDDGRGRQLATGHHREALRPRPQERPGAQRDRRGRLPARLRLPHRPLPRQGDGAEPPRPAVRQPALRAGVERQLRRPRADHDGRGHRHRRARRLLRRHRRRARRHPEPPPAAARPDRHGGAGLLRRQGPARREGEGAVGRPPARRPRQGRRARAVCRRLAGRRGGRRLPRGGRRRPGVDHRDLRRRHPRGRHASLGRRPVLPAHRQAARQAGHRDRGRLQACPAPAVRAHGDGGARPERHRHPRAARRGRDHPLRLQGARCADGGARRDDGLRLRLLLHRGLPRGLRAPHPRRPARRAAALPTARGGRVVVADPRSAHEALGQVGQARAVSSPAPGGPQSADRMLERDGRTWRMP